MITVEKTVRQAKKSGAATTEGGKKPVPKWFWYSLIGIGVIATVSYFRREKSSGNELSGFNSVQSGTN